jgi:hypothetical protein
MHIADNLEFQASHKQKNALKHFQKFLDIQFPGTGYLVHEIPTSIVTNDTFGCFMTYLSRDAHHYCDETKALLMLNSADGYASSVKQFVSRTLYRDKPVPTVFHKTQWADLRKKLAKQVKERVKRDGGQLRGGHKTADKGDRKALAHLCMWTNTQASAEFYALNSTQYEVGGRAAEVAAVNFENLSIHSLEEFGKDYQILALNIMKDKQEQGLTQDLEIFVHRSCWELDWYFAIAVRTILFDEDSQFFFPKFQTQVRIVRKDGNVDSKVSDLWSSTFSTLMELLDGYGDQLTDRMVSGLNRRLSSHSQKRCLAQVSPFFFVLNL